MQICFQWVLILFDIWNQERGPKIENFQHSGTLIRTKTIQKEVTPQLYHSDEDEIQSQYSNELSQLRKIDTILVIKQRYKLLHSLRSVIGLQNYSCFFAANILSIISVTRMSFRTKGNIMIMEVSKTVNLTAHKLLSMNISKILTLVPIFQAPF